MYKEEHTWLVIQTFYKREMDVSAFLTEHGVSHFIPMRYRERPTGDGRLRRALVPVIHNYVFIEKRSSVRELRQLLAACPIPLHLLHHRDSQEPCEIPNREMFEFRMLCDPQFDSRLAVAEDTEDAPVGKEVEVVHGHFAGIRGRLVRKRGQYWFIKTVVGISVMLRITRWFCKPV